MFLAETGFFFNLLDTTDKNITITYNINKSIKFIN